MLKRLAKSSFAQGVIALLIYSYLRFVYLTSRWHVEGRDIVEKFGNGKRGVIFCFWHGRLALIAPFKPSEGQVYVMISQNRDGEIIARVMQKFGLGAIRGSSRNPNKTKNKGSTAVGRQAIEILRDGGNICITPDGPKGPNREVKGSIIDLAAKTGAIIIPVTYSISRGKHLKSWDNFLFPYPFSRGAFLVGHPLNVPDYAKKIDLEGYARELGQQLNDLTLEADRRIGR